LLLLSFVHVFLPNKNDASPGNDTKLNAEAGNFPAFVTKQWYGPEQGLRASGAASLQKALSWSEDNFFSLDKNDGMLKHYWRVRLWLGRVKANLSFKFWRHCSNQAVKQNLLQGQSGLLRHNLCYDAWRTVEGELICSKHKERLQCSDFYAFVRLKHNNSKLKHWSKAQVQHRRQVGGWRFFNNSCLNFAHETDECIEPLCRLRQVTKSKGDFSSYFTKLQRDFERIDISSASFTCCCR